MSIEDINNRIEEMANTYQRELNSYGVSFNQLLSDKFELSRYLTQKDLDNLGRSESNVLKQLDTLKLIMEGILDSKKHSLAMIVCSNTYGINNFSAECKELYQVLQDRYGHMTVQLQGVVDQMGNTKQGFERYRIFKNYLHTKLGYNCTDYWNRFEEDTNFIPTITPSMPGYLYTIIQDCLILDIINKIKARDMRVVSKELKHKFERSADERLLKFIDTCDSIYKIFFCIRPSIFLSFIGMNTFNNKDYWPWKDNLIPTILDKIQTFNINNKRIMKLNMLGSDRNCYENLDITMAISLLKLKYLLQRAQFREITI